MLSRYVFLCVRSSLQGKEKKCNQSALGINLSVWNRLLRTPSRKDTTFAWRTEEASENDASKHAETSATNTCADHPLLLQKQKYLISSGSKAKVSHIMLFPYPFLCPSSCLQNKEKGSNQSELEIKRLIRN
ncbi:hypothetical protein ACFX2J_000446 [Malus domestica]